MQSGVEDSWIMTQVNGSLVLPLPARPARKINPKLITDAAQAPTNIIWINQTPRLNHNFQLFFIKVVIYVQDKEKRDLEYEDIAETEHKDEKHNQNFDDYFYRLRDDSQPRLRICFDPEHEIPLLQKWFNLNNHPTRGQVKYNKGSFQKKIQRKE